MFPIKHGLVGVPIAIPQPPPPGTELIEKYRDYNAVEIWPFEDAGGGAAALNNPNHNLNETGGSNFAYRVPFSNFPETIGIELTLTSPAAYLRSGSGVAALRLKEQMSVAFVIKATQNYTYPSIGCMAEEDGTPATNSPWCFGLGLFGTFGRGPNWGFQRGNNEIVRGNTSYSSLMKENAEYLVVIKRRTIEKKHTVYLNGQFLGEYSYTGDGPDGGEATEMIVGKGLSQLETGTRHYSVFSAISVFDGGLEAENALRIQEAAMKLKSRFPAFTLTESKNYGSSMGDNLTSDGRACIMLTDSATSVGLANLDGMEIGASVLLCQWRNGIITATESGGRIITGDKVTAGAGTILKITKTTATEYVGEIN